jgi:putative hydrolases of HD superfamily
MTQNYTSLVHFLNEAGMLAEIPRSGFAFLGSGKQSVAEHSFRVALAAFALASLMKQKVDHYKLTMLCLLHDLPESRIGDLNYVQKKYVCPDLDKALKDIESAYPMGNEVVSWIKEYEEGITLEAQIAHDADQLELLLMLKREEELGNPRALEWFKNSIQRLISPEAKLIAESISKTPTDGWWMTDRNDPHWINGGKETRDKK